MHRAPGPAAAKGPALTIFERAAAGGAATIRSGANAAIEALRRSLWPRGRPLAAQRLCVYRIGNIGDTVCAVPAIRAVRRAYPDARVTVLSSPGKRGAPGARDLLDDARWIDELLVYHAEDIADHSGRARLLDELRERKFDVWIELPAVDTLVYTQMRNMIVARAAGARWGGGWELGPLPIATRAQSAVLEFPNEVERLLRIVAKLGIDRGAPEFPLPVAESHRAKARRILNEAGLSGRPLVAFAPGAKCESNLWPLERFVTVGRHLRGRGCGVIILGGPLDRDTCALIAARAGAISLAGRISILESCAMLERCEFVISLDSGVQHLAAAMGTRCLSLFSCKGFRGIWHPYGIGHAVIRKWADCDTCLRLKCPYGNYCMSLIGTEEVIAHADRMIDTASRIGERDFARPIAADCQ